MPKMYHRELSFQSGEISPRYNGRSNTEIYDKGLATAENLLIDKHGGAFKRQGLYHAGRINGNSARVFTLQVDRLKYYTLILHANPNNIPGFPTELIIIAPGAQLIGNNEMSNSNFAQGALDWGAIVTPSTSNINFHAGSVDLLPEQNDPELVTDPDFSAELANWIVRETGSSVVSSIPGQITLTPQQVAGRLAGISQSIVTGTPNITHTLNIAGQFNSNIRAQAGTAEDDGTYLDTTIGLEGEVTFTPTASPFFITVDCIAPEANATLTQVSIKSDIEKIAGVAQTVTTLTPGLVYTVVVGQRDSQQIVITIEELDETPVMVVSSSKLQTVFEFTATNSILRLTAEANGDVTEKATLTFIGMGESIGATELGILMDAPWLEDHLNDINIIETPEGQALYFTHPNIPTQKLVYSFASDTFSTLSPVSFINKPVSWQLENYPSTGTYFQGRLWLASTPADRETIWASKSGLPEDFGINDDTLIPPAPTDATGFTIILQEYGRIEWLLGTKNLLIGTESGEHIATSESGILTPSDSQIEKQSAFGSNGMQALQVGEKVFYLTPDGRKLRGMSYQWEEDNWLSQDLTFISEHITQGIGKFSAWAQHPNNFFILILEDGTLAIMTYDRTAKTTGWSHHTFTGLKALDISTGRNQGVDELVVVGQRVPGFIDIETTAERLELLDSYVVTDSIIPNNIVTGLDHLEGETVISLVDGAVDVPRIVIGGQITTQNSGLRIATGLSYTGRLVTLTQDEDKGGNQIRSFKKRWNKVWALMLDSKAPIINGVRPPDRTPSTLMDTVEPNSSGHFKTVNLGWDDFGQITIEQDLPVAMFVLAIYGEIGVESL